MADETMFARLVEACRQALERELGIGRPGMDYVICAKISFIADDMLTEADDDPVPAIVRALLAELRKGLAESEPGYISMPGVLTAAQQAALTHEWSKRAHTAVASFIDAILAEAGGSGG